jgi:hypothetical protein
MGWGVEIGHFGILIDAFELQIEVLGILEKKVVGDGSIGIKNPFCSALRRVDESYPRILRPPKCFNGPP